MFVYVEARAVRPMVMLGFREVLEWQLQAYYQTLQR